MFRDCWVWTDQRIYAGIPEMQAFFAIYFFPLKEAESKIWRKYFSKTQFCHFLLRVVFQMIGYINDWIEVLESSHTLSSR